MQRCTAPECFLSDFGDSRREHDGLEFVPGFTESAGNLGHPVGEREPGDVGVIQKNFVAEKAGFVGQIDFHRVALGECQGAYRHAGMEGDCAIFLASEESFGADFFEGFGERWQFEVAAIAEGVIADLLQIGRKGYGCKARAG